MILPLKDKSVPKAISLLLTIVTVLVFSSCDQPSPDENDTWAKIYKNAEQISPGYLSCISADDGGFIIHQNGLYQNNSLIKINDAGAIIWQKKYDIQIEQIVPIEIDGSKNYICFGKEVKNRENSCLMKIRMNGDVAWKKRYNSNDKPLMISGIAISEFGDSIIISGLTKDTDTPETTYPIYAKIDANGQILWEKRITSIKEYALKCRPTSTSDGAFIIWIETSSDNFIFKIDSNGNTLWGKSFSTIDGSSNIGDNNHNEYWKKVVKSVDGGCIIVGYSENTAIGVVWVAKFDANGNKIWATELNTFLLSSPKTHTAYWDKASLSPADICETKDGGIAVLCNQSTFKSMDYSFVGFYFITNYKGWIAKLNGGGEILWQKSYEDKTKFIGPILSEVSDVPFNKKLFWYTENSIHVSTLCEANDGGFIFTGYLHPELNYDTIPEKAHFVVKTDSEGDFSTTELIMNDADAQSGEIDFISEDILLFTYDDIGVATDVVAEFTNTEFSISDL